MSSSSTFLASCLVMSMLSGVTTLSRADAPGEALSLIVSPTTIRVRLLSTKVPTRLSCAGSFRYGTVKSGTSKLSKGSIKVRATAGSIIFGQTRIKGRVVVVPEENNQSLTINGRRYRGTLVFHPLGGSRYEVIEYMSFSEYLYGVLPKEVDPKWHIESLKAQAVVSRSYAMANKLVRARERYDVVTSVMDQVYGGQESESPESNRAVDETQGILLLDRDNKPVRAFFHAACGGRTDMPENVWKTNPAHHVYAVVDDKDYCADYPRNKWTLSMSLTTLRERLRRAGLRTKSITDISILNKSASGRAQSILLQTSKGEVQVAGNRFRLALGPEVLRSTFLTTAEIRKRTVYFEGLGWGHGVGLCQWGARGRAMRGQTYKEILEAYFPSSRVVLQ